MNIAFPALFAFLLVLPGLIFRYSYARGSWGWASPTSLRSVTDEISLGMAFALFGHVAWIALFQLSDLKPDIADALGLLTGYAPQADSWPGEGIRSVSSHPFRVAGYFLSLYVASAVAGYLAHQCVRKAKLDLTFKSLRFNNRWYYLLTGEATQFAEYDGPADRVDGVYLSAVVVLGSEPYLYGGLVKDFTFTSSGELDTIVLGDAHRRALKDDRHVSEEASVDDARPTDDRYYDIRGDLFVLRYADTRTLNVDYFSLAEEVATCLPTVPAALDQTPPDRLDISEPGPAAD